MMDETKSGSKAERRAQKLAAKAAVGAIVDSGDGGNRQAEKSLDQIERRIEKQLTALEKRMNAQIGEALRRSALVARRAPDLAEFHGDEQFLGLGQAVLIQDRTLLGLDRLFTLWQAIRNVHKLGLPAAEVGSFRGGSAYFMASAFKAFSGREHDLHVFDTFEGHPPEVFTDHDPDQRARGFGATSYEAVCAYLAPFTGVHVHKGEFSKSVLALPEMRFSLAHLDTDLYLPTLEGLRYFGARLPLGGVIVVDDYWAPKCQGVRDAVAEFFKEPQPFQVWYPDSEQLLLIKGEDSRP